MALATQCPHCHTTFRVAHDQLKLRAGLVRCGSCKEIFNGIDHLLPHEPATAARMPEAPLDEDASSAAPAAAESAPAPEPGKHLASEQLDFVYPDMGEEEPVAESDAAASDLTKPASIPDTVLAPHSNDPVEVEFVETPRKAPLPTPSVAEPEPVFPFHGEAPDVPLVQPSAAADADVSETETPADGGPVDHSPADPLTRMTLIDVEEQGDVPPPDPEAPDPLDKVMEDFERKPGARGRRARGGKGRPYARSPLVTTPDDMPRVEPSMEDVPEEHAGEPGSGGAAESAAEQLGAHEPATENYSEAEEPEFVKRERYQRTRGRTIRIIMNVCSVLMLFLAVGQAAYIFRDQLAARFPETQPALQRFCSVLGCRVGLPAQIEALLIEPGSDHLEKLSTRKDTSELTLVMRNTANELETWPLLELTLNDSNNMPLARRVFTPQEYLPAGADPQKGFGPNAEQPVKIYIEFADTQPSGYSVGLFYR